MLIPTLLLATALAADPWADVATTADMSIGEVQALMAGIEKDQTILDRMSKPWEAKPWFQYGPIFLNDPRVAGGAAFWKTHADQLAKVESETGVPAQVIVAILGVETKYGVIQGNDPVTQALYTLGFHHPRRGEFFRKELGFYLGLATTEGWDLHGQTGSYAGAMGMGQFIPSSYVRYAVDGDGDGRRDLFANPDDAIASVGNYFKVHGWTADHRVLLPVTGPAQALAGQLHKGLQLDQSWSDLAALGIQSQTPIDSAEAVRIFAFETENGTEYFAALRNFYVITRYNHSALYARAVYDLSERIRLASTEVQTKP
jgi:membrane-bound lytic murein transglycosylase B